MPANWFTLGAAGINSAAGLLGGFMNRGLSQRDAMQAQSEFAIEHRRKELLHSPEWEMQGLRRAGINPMLPYAKGGAPNPSGFSPGVTAPINPGQFLPQGVASGLSSAADFMRTEAQVKKTFADIDKIAAEIPGIHASTALTGQQRINAVAEQRRIFADEVLKIGQSVLNSEQLKNLQAQRNLLETEIAINAWREASEEAHAKLLASGIPLAQADSEFYESWFGKFLRYMEKGKDAVNPFGGSGLGAPLRGGPR